MCGGRVASHDEREQIRNCLGRLDDLEREIIIRRFFYEQKTKEGDAIYVVTDAVILETGWEKQVWQPVQTCRLRLM